MENVLVFPGEPWEVAATRAVQEMGYGNRNPLAEIGFAIGYMGYLAGAPREGADEVPLFAALGVEHIQAGWDEAKRRLDAKIEESEPLLRQLFGDAADALVAGFRRIAGEPAAVAAEPTD